MAKLTDVLDKIVKDRLDEQVKHLKSLSEKPEDEQAGRSSKEWRYLYLGAETVIDLLSHDLSHKNRLSYFFGSMDIDELKRYKSDLNERINKIESEPKITIFGVCQDRIYHGWFTKYSDAKALLIKLADEEIDIEDEYEFSFGIDKKEVFESQVNEYLRT